MRVMRPDRPGLVSQPFCRRCGGLRREWRTWWAANRRRGGFAGGLHRLCCCSTADCCTCGNCEFEVDVAQLRINLLQMDRCTYANNDCTGAVTSADTFKTESAFSNTTLDMCRNSRDATNNLSTCYGLCGVWCEQTVPYKDRAFSATCPPSGAFDAVPNSSWEVCVSYDCSTNNWRIETASPALPSPAAITAANGWAITSSTCAGVEAVWGYTCNGVGDKDRVEVDLEVINNEGCEGV